MKLKAQQVYDATLTVSQIIRDNRPMPQKGKYRLARLHAKLLPEFTPISERRDAMITAYDYRAKAKVVGNELLDEAPIGPFSVPPDKAAEFAEAWKEIGEQEIEVDVESVPLAYLELGDGVDGSISANELVTLGDLVRE